MGTITSTATVDPAGIGKKPHHAMSGRAALTLGALGVVFGDIGTSPLYALQATLDPRYHLGIDVIDLCGIVSLIFWSFVFVTIAARAEASRYTR
jgi:KUP system potassium uptake protein